MQFNKRLLCFVSIFTLLIHVGALYLCDRLPLPVGNIPPSHLSPYLGTFQEKMDRNEALAEIFQTTREKPAEVKNNFKDLQPERVPAPTLALCAEEFILPSLSLPSLPTLPTLPSEENGDLLTCENLEFSEMDFQVVSILNPHPLADFEMNEDAYEALGALTNPEHFTLSIEYAPRIFRPGYVFKIILQPKKEAPFKRIRQNYFFLIDRSNSIPRARYALNKKVVSRALDSLNEGDCFNILIFDDRVSRFSENVISWNEENVALARAFLDTQGHGGYFAATELYASLGKIIPQNVSDQEVNTAILLSDGDTYLSLEKQRQTIGGWTTANGGKVSLFCVASGTGNNLSLLELISAFNKGNLLYVSDHEQLSDRVSQLIDSLHFPIGKDLVATSVSAESQVVIHLQPKSSRLPHLYKNRSFVIWGSTNKLTDFTLFLQGKYYDRVFDIKKTVHFKDAQNGTLALEKQWAQLVAQEYYEQFFQDGKTKHLEAAKQFLSPLNIHVPFVQQP